MKFDLSSFQMQKADESFFKSSNKSMTMKQLDAQLDTMKKELQIVRRNLTGIISTKLIFINCGLLSGRWERKWR